MNFIVNILGSGAALPTGRRRCSAQVLNINGFKILLDCAEGTQDRIRHHHVKLQSLGTILISHLHGDHFFGLPGLLSTMHLCGRTEPVTLIAPRGARESIETLFDLTGNHIGFPVNHVELDFSEGLHRVLETPRCAVDAFPLVHSVPTYGFRISAFDHHAPAATADPDQPPVEYVPRPPRVYTYCCDTVYDESIVPYIKDSDLLCLECTFADQLAELALQRQHLTAGQAARLAALANPKQLLLSHISARYKEPQILLDQATAHFANTLLAADGMAIDIQGK